MEVDNSERFHEYIRLEENKWKPYDSDHYYADLAKIHSKNNSTFDYIMTFPVA